MQKLKQRYTHDKSPSFGINWTTGQENAEVVNSSTGSTVYIIKFHDSQRKNSSCDIQN